MRSPAERRSWFSRAAQLGLGDCADLMVAAAELVRARALRHRLMRQAPRVARRSSPGDAARLPARIGRAVERASRIVPWQANCLVQALAARHWLARRGIESDLTIGVRKSSGAAPDAHAWLRCGETIVVGGGAEDYAFLCDMNPPRAADASQP